jgi:hypothetical protein
MFHLLYTVVSREMDDGTYRPRNRRLVHKSFGKDLNKNAERANG